MMTRFTQHRTQLAQLSLCLTWLMLPFWLKWSGAPPPFSATYTLGFVVVLPMLLTILLWIGAGCPNWRTLIRDDWHVMWWLMLVLLVAWAWLTQFWAFGDERTTGITPNYTLQVALMAAFLIVNACIAPRRVILYLLMVNLLLHGAIGALQVSIQGDIGLSLLGEVTLRPEVSGTSVIASGDLRWLRPYGLLPHPNIYAGFMLTGTLAAAWAAITLKTRRNQIISLVVFACGLWMLMLTFSRGAWLGFAIGTLFALFFVLRRRLWRRLIAPVVIALMLAGVFFALYQPLLLARTAISLEGTEQRSIADRLVYWRIAERAIADAPMFGIGAAHFPWYAADYLWYETNYDLRGDNVHNVLMLIWSELGFIGIAIISFHLLGATVAIMRQRDLDQVALLAVALALFVVGFFDHYPWTLLQTQILWLGVLAVALAPTQESGVGVGGNTGMRCA